jgi:signal transduction histidine kinase
VVHDFNNLLTVIAGYAEMASKGLGDHPCKEDVSRILRATDQAQRLVQQLLAFSKKRQIVKRAVDLGAVTKHTLDLLQASLPKDIKIELHGSDRPVTVQGDDAPLQQVLMNLCLNARDAMPKGGRLMVETVYEQALPSQAVPSAKPTNGVQNGTKGHGEESTQKWVRLTVADTGTGMNEEVKARIFEPLFTTKERGSGLGLAVVKQIVEGFGGSISVTSAPGKGTRFDVWLTAPPPAAPPPGQ